MNSTKKILQAGMIAILLYFAQLSAYASTPAPGGENVSFTFNLQKGTNLISLPVLTTYTAESLASTPGSNIKYITAYNTTSEEQRTYVLGFSGKEDNFEIKPDYGYFIYVTDNCTLTVKGQKAGIRNVPLKEGFNIVGWTSTDKSTAAEAFAAPLGSALINASKRNADGSFLTYTPGVSGKDDDFTVTPGEGYIVYVKNNSILSYGGAPGPAGDQPTRETSKPLPGIEAALAIAAIILLAQRIKR